LNTQRKTFRCHQYLFGQSGRVALKQVVLKFYLNRKACQYITVYGLEAFALHKFTLKSLDSSVDCSLMKLFKTSFFETIIECQKLFMFQLPSVMLADGIYNLQKMESIAALFQIS
jgi:hypothetical protein